jgi:type II secretory pathway pseudopilin PulG
MRRPFLLLEVVIAMALIAALSGALVMAPLIALRREVRNLQKIEVLRLVELKLMELRSELPARYEKLPLKASRAPWEKIVEKVNGVKVTVEYRVWCQKIKVTPEGKTAACPTIRIRQGLWIDEPQEISYFVAPKE